MAQEGEAGPVAAEHVLSCGQVEEVDGWGVQMYIEPILLSWPSVPPAYVPVAGLY